MKVTAESLTDEQIREFRDSTKGQFFEAYGQNWDYWQLCMDAQAKPDYSPKSARVRVWTRTRACELVAAAINARAKVNPHCGVADCPGGSLHAHDPSDWSNNARAKGGG